MVIINAWSKGGPVCVPGQIQLMVQGRSGSHLGSSGVVQGRSGSHLCYKPCGWLMGACRSARGSWSCTVLLYGYSSGWSWWAHRCACSRFAWSVSQEMKLLRGQQVQWQALLAVSMLEYLQAALAWLGPCCWVKSLLLGWRQGVALG